jgi:outer membrane protein OmpA-like peptidoglycan-associated protein
VDGERIGDVNQMFVPEKDAPPDHWTIRQRCDRPGSGPQPDWIGIRSVRVAESAPDFSAMMASSGKYVTHGILFDTDSDRLKPESAPVLKAVALGLEKNPNLGGRIRTPTKAVKRFVEPDLLLFHNEV